MGRSMTANGTADRPRIDWVDYAKGFCIIFVVMMHSTLGVENAARPGGLAGQGRRLRQAVPDAGLLPDLRPVPGPGHRPRLAHLSRPQGRALRLFLPAVDGDPVCLQGPDVRRTSTARWARSGSTSNRSGSRSARSGSSISCRSSSWRPSSRTACASRRWRSGSSAPRSRSRISIPAATVIDEFASRFVYFYTGYLFAPHIFALAKQRGASAPRRRSPASRSGA